VTQMWTPAPAKTPSASASGNLDQRHIAWQIGTADKPSNTEAIASLLTREGETLQRLRAMAATLGFGLMLYDEAGRAIAITEEPRAKEPASGGIAPRSLQGFATISNGICHAASTLTNWRG